MEENLLFNKEDLLLPLQAYSYFPPQNLIYSGTDKKIVRFIFYEIEFTPFQNFQLQGYKKLITKQFQQLPPYFTDQQLVRILIGCKFNQTKALKALKKAIQWRQSSIVRTFINQLETSGELLEQGGIYLQGMDHRFRPLIVINLSRMDLKRFSVFQYCGLLCYVLDYTMKHYMIPGQVQNWIILTDLCRIGLLSLPFSDLKKIIKILQDNYRCRMIVNYVVNAPMTISGVWCFAKKFVDQHTVKKIKIMRKSEPEELKTHFNMAQIEKKYGGNAPIRQQFWPPQMVGSPYHLEGESPDQLLSPHSTYQQYHPIPEFSEVQDIAVEHSVYSVAQQRSEISSSRYERSEIPSSRHSRHSSEVFLESIEFETVHPPDPVEASCSEQIEEKSVETPVIARVPQTQQFTIQKKQEVEYTEEIGQPIQESPKQKKKCKWLCGCFK